MIDLNKQIGPLPLKMWLLIGVGGVGIGYLATRKQDTSTGLKTPGNATTETAINQLSNKLNGLYSANESVTGMYGDQAHILETLSERLSVLSDKVTRIGQPTQTKAVTDVPKDFAQIGDKLQYVGPKMWTGTEQGTVVTNVGSGYKLTNGITSTI